MRLSTIWLLQDNALIKQAGYVDFMAKEDAAMVALDRMITLYSIAVL